MCMFLVFQFCFDLIIINKTTAYIEVSAINNGNIVKYSQLN